METTNQVNEIQSTATPDPVETLLKVLTRFPEGVERDEFIQRRIREHLTPDESKLVWALAKNYKISEVLKGTDKAVMEIYAVPGYQRYSVWKLRKENDPTRGHYELVKETEHCNGKRYTVFYLTPKHEPYCRRTNEGAYSPNALRFTTPEKAQTYIMEHNLIVDSADWSLFPETIEGDIEEARSDYEKLLKEREAESKKEKAKQREYIKSIAGTKILTICASDQRGRNFHISIYEATKNGTFRHAGHHEGYEVRGFVFSLPGTDEHRLAVVGDDYDAEPYKQSYLPSGAPYTWPIKQLQAVVKSLRCK